ncbi:class I SAM-dependent methyltransferase [Actinobacteria bacterium YIM 96077]|uniref:SAM-dependent methyltransferase n=1 Tax=Phytoactinopolyspora halophila TaxID=1981511 RepID=A0A329R0K5_9ACTN|nr:class I SAM-dependent methyltransferase [Phytoactinopolyspora halophila]AYY11755.1 class I SAM-dependent methyltransferase [Actinobacteria bacterium YIM 96077]RAW18154.1 SAM-dependent methyltransferase [Phytoactinopolyspora halophila]
MCSDRHRLLAASFSSVADIYERSRPGYPDEAVRWLAGAAPARVLDLGAGTGKLTRSLREHGHDVVAVDPSAPMLEQLTAVLPDVDARLGSAEEIPVPDASVDVVVVAQAYHWFDDDVAMPEIARVLGADGHVALVWNLRDASVPWVDELWTRINPEEPREIVAPEVDGSLFGPVESATFRHTQTLDKQRLLELVMSRSYVAVQSPDERTPLLADVSEIYDAHAGPDGIIDPYVTYCFRAARMSAEYV